MPAENLKDLKTIIDDFKSENNPEIKALMPELTLLLVLSENTHKPHDQKQFFHVLKDIVGKLEQINNPSKSVAKSIEDLQLLMIMQSSLKVVAIIGNLLSSIATVSAKSDEMKELDSFTNQCVKYASMNAVFKEAIGNDDNLNKLRSALKILNSIGQVNDIFKTLETKINTIDQSRSSSAYHEATNLLNKLNAARYVFYEKLPNLENEAGLEPLSKAFIKECTEAINGSKQVLEKERGWGEFLVDFLESLVKAVVKVVTLGFGSTNFSFYSNPNKDVRTTLDEAQADLAKSKLG